MAAKDLEYKSRVEVVGANYNNVKSCSSAINGAIHSLEADGFNLSDIKMGINDSDITFIVIGKKKVKT